MADSPIAIPFLRPVLPPAASYLPWLQQMDAAGIYSNFGPLARQLEAEILAADFGGTGAVVTVANATLGLMLALSALSRRPGGWAIMPSFTFAATPLAAMWSGLRPFFVDIQPSDWSLDPAALEAALAELGEAVAAVVPCATFGCPLDLEPYARLHQRGIPVVVDAAPSMGVQPHGQQFGAGFPGAVVFSLHATKPFGIGEGGLVYSADAALAARIRAGANFGFDASRVAQTQGLNAKLSEPAAAIGLAVHRNFAQQNAGRRQLAGAYRRHFLARGLEQRGWAMQHPRADCPQFQPLLCPPGQSGRTVAAALASRGIECRTYFSPACHQQPAFAHAGAGPLTRTEWIAARVLSLPFWQGLTDAHLDKIFTALEQSTAC